MTIVLCYRIKLIKLISVCLFVVAFFTDLKKIKCILNKSTEILSQFLDPSHILNKLASKEHLKVDDKDRIRQYPAISDRVRKLLEMLQRKEKEAYFSFMVALRTERPDLFKVVIDIECHYTSGVGHTFGIPFISEFANYVL